MAMEVPKNGWLIMEIPIKMNDLGVPLFQETSIFCLLFANSDNIPRLVPTVRFPPIQFISRCDHADRKTMFSLGK